jgi:hypothetical protein
MDPRIANLGTRLQQLEDTVGMLQLRLRRLEGRSYWDAAAVDHSGRTDPHNNTAPEQDDASASVALVQPPAARPTNSQVGSTTAVPPPSHAEIGVHAVPEEYDDHDATMTQSPLPTLLSASIRRKPIV